MDRKGKQPPDEDITTTFISTMTTPREIQDPIAVKEGKKKKEAERLADEYEIMYDPESDKEHNLEKFRQNSCYRCFITREIARYLDRTTYVTVSFREAILYLIFLILITLITIGSTPLDMFYFSQAMETLYTKQEFDTGTGAKKSFYDINTKNDVWNYQLSIIHSLYHDFWYSKPDPYENTETLQESYLENKLIGMAQIRQVRVSNDSCEVQNSFKDLYKSCYGRFSYSNEITEDFGGGDEWKYKSADVSETASIDGILTTYSGGGFVALLQNVNDRAVQTIYKLRNNLWIDRATRAVFIEFTIYNGNINLFCTFKIIFEFPSCGGVVPSHWNYVQKLIKYNDSYDMFILFCEIIFCIFFIFFTIQKLIEIKTLKFKLLKSFWNWIDIVILCVCYSVIVLDILLYVVVHDRLPELVAVQNQWNYASFDRMFYIHILYSYNFAVLIAFSYFRLLKYLDIVNVMHELQCTIARAVPDILNYCVLFLYAYFSFALVGHFLFGSHLEDYKSFSMAVFALMRSSVGDFNYHRLEQADPFYGPIFFFLFIFFIGFILVNVFLAILVSKYEEVRSEVRIGGAKTFIGDMLSLWTLRLVRKAGWTWVLSQIERKQVEKKVRSPTEAIRQYLSQAGYSELEIELFFKKYDITDSKISAMDEDKFSYRQGEREAPPPLTQKDISRYIVIQKLEYLESHYQAANRLMDEFLSKLSKFEARK